MKTMFRVVTITAALTCAGASKVLAQDEPPSPPSTPPPVAIIHDVQSVAEGAVHKAQADVENQMRQVQQRLTKLKDRVFMTQRGKTDKSLVVRSSDMAPRTQGDLEEDMTIMTHILDKAVAARSSDDQFGHVAMGINVAFVPGEGPTRSIYVDGYGALFFLNVNFPLLPPPVEKNVEKEKEPKDSTWEEAKEEVYGQPAAKSPQVEYDAAKVTALKGALLDALKNASNIRSVRSDESITVCVIGAPLRRPVRLVSGGGFGHSVGGGGGGFGGGGGGASSGGGGFGAFNSTGGASGDSGETIWVSGGGNEDAAGNRTTLTIRAKKADCVAFANGNLTTEEFRKRAVITIYGDPADKP